jgi:hypothetical protein
MVGVMVFSSPALADPNPTLGGRWGYDRGDYYGRSYNEMEALSARERLPTKTIWECRPLRVSKVM